MQPLITLVAGSKAITTLPELEKAVKGSGMAVSRVICGRCPGVDWLTPQWCNRNDIPCEVYGPDWLRSGPSAPAMLAKSLVSRAQQAIILWDGQSPNTKKLINMILGTRSIKLHVHHVHGLYQTQLELDLQ